MRGGVGRGVSSDDVGGWSARSSGQGGAAHRGVGGEATMDGRKAERLNMMNVKCHEAKGYPAARGVGSLLADPRPQRGGANRKVPKDARIVRKWVALGATRLSEATQRVCGRVRFRG